MLTVGLISMLVAVPLFSSNISSYQFHRITAVVLIYSALLSIQALNIQCVSSGIGIYNGLFQVSSLSLGTEIFLLITGAFLLIGWNNDKKTQNVINMNEYSLIILFTVIGQTLLLSSADIISIYLSIELQSFGVYILATLYRNSESATAAGLKYFLLGGLSSAIILLGTAYIYSYTGITQFDNIYCLCTISDDNNTIITPVILGLVLIGVGFLFKVAASPFHNWAPDVYDGVPTIVTSWLATIPKISILIFLLELQSGITFSYENSIMISDINIWKSLLLVTSLLSLLFGTIIGLSQYRIKRLLAFSTISHVGFLLLSLSVNTQESVEAFMFYVFQYSLTNVNTFLILLGFIYIIKKDKDIELIEQLKGQFMINPLLTVSFAICLFSIAGIPPLVGFFGKQLVLYSSTHAGYYFISIIAILVSVISASYYLKIIKVIYFDSSMPSINNQFNNYGYITNIHSFSIASLTVFITIFVLHPSILLNSCHLLALSIYNY